MPLHSVTASEAKHRLGACIEAALVEPVVIERSGRPVVMLISVAEYQRLKRHEQAPWQTLAEGYAAMAADEVREQEARAWVDGVSPARDDDDASW